MNEQAKREVSISIDPAASITPAMRRVCIGTRIANVHVDRGSRDRWSGDIRTSPSELVALAQGFVAIARGADALSVEELVDTACAQVPVRHLRHLQRGLARMVHDAARVVAMSNDELQRLEAEDATFGDVLKRIGRGT